MCPPKDLYQKNLRSLNDFQKLIGNINWIHSSLEIPNSELNNIFSTMEGDKVLNSPRCLAQKAHKELNFNMD